MSNKIKINVVAKYRNVRNLNITYCDLCDLNRHMTERYGLCDTCTGNVYYKIDSIEGDFELNVIE